MKKSKRYREALTKVENDKVYSVDAAVGILKEMAAPKFDETVEISLKLGADPKKSDQMIRGSVILPGGTGKKVKILVFCEPAKEAEAREAGADFVGGEDLIEKISKEGWLEFDSCISTPSMMRNVSKLGRVLGPRGLMPSPKTGAVTDNLANAVKEAKAGKVDFRMDKFACMSIGVGKVSFEKDTLVKNTEAFIDALSSARPSSLKGDLIRSMYMSSTMSPSLRVQV